MIIVDTGPLVAAAIVDDRDHARCVDLFEHARRDRIPLVVPAFVAAEACYMLEREGGSTVEAAFLRSLRGGGPFVFEALHSDDLDRMAALIQKYSDLRLGASDASVIAVAERLGVARIATIDTRDFRVVRPRHVVAFTLLPD